MKFYRKLVLVLGASTVIATLGATIALANPGTLITTTILGHRATLADSVDVNQDRIKFQTKDPTDVCRRSPSSRTAAPVGISTQAS